MAYQPCSRSHWQPCKAQKLSNQSCKNQDTPGDISYSRPESSHYSVRILLNLVLIRKRLNNCGTVIHQLTFQKVFDAIFPGLRVGLILLLEPDQSTFNVGLWGHRAETQSGVVANDAFLLLVFGMLVSQSQCEQTPQSHEKGRQDGIEN